MAAADSAEAAAEAAEAATGSDDVKEGLENDGLDRAAAGPDVRKHGAAAGAGNDLRRCASGRHAGSGSMNA